MVSTLFFILIGIMLVNGTFRIFNYHKDRNDHVKKQRAAPGIIQCAVVCCQQGICNFVFDSINRCTPHTNLKSQWIHHTSWHNLECEKANIDQDRGHSVKGTGVHQKLKNAHVERGRQGTGWLWNIKGPVSDKAMKRTRMNWRMHGPSKGGILKPLTKGLGDNEANRSGDGNRANWSGDDNEANWHVKGNGPAQEDFVP